jgi:hypothetical protein
MLVKLGQHLQLTVNKIAVIKLREFGEQPSGQYRAKLTCVI